MPHAKESNLHVNRGLLELRTCAGDLFVIVLIRCVRGLQLIELGFREKPDFLEHAGEGTSCIGTTRETKNTYFISGLIWLDTVSFQRENKSSKQSTNNVPLEIYIPLEYRSVMRKITGREEGRKDL